MPDLALCRTLPTRDGLAAAAAALASSGEAADGEFHVSLLDARGCELARVLTGADAIAVWLDGGATLPTPLEGGRWATDIARAAAAAAASEEVRSRMRAAWKAGAVGAADAMRLTAEARRLLDPEVDED